MKHLMEMGIATQMDSLLIELDGSAEFQLGLKMPEQIKTIYGISVQVDGVTPNNQALITTAQASDLYLTFISGSNRFWNTVRLSDLVYMPDPDSSAMAITDAKYMYVNIDAQGLSLDQSFINNPTTIAAGPIIFLNLWYEGFGKEGRPERVEAQRGV